MQQAGRLTWFDRAGMPLGSVGPDGDHDYADFRLSPDVTRLAASPIDPKLSLPDIWSMDLVRGGNSRWTFGPALNASVLWSPAGDAIVFRTNRKGMSELYRRRPFAAASDEPLLPEELARAAGVDSSIMMPTDWSADGRYFALTAKTPSDIWLLPLATPASPFRSCNRQATRCTEIFLCRYALRPPVAGAGLHLTADGQVMLQLRHPWADGTTHVAFTPTAFLERLAVLVPRPHVTLVLYHGLLAPRAAWRAEVVPGGLPAPPMTPTSRRPRPM